MLFGGEDGKGKRASAKSTKSILQIIFQCPHSTNQVFLEAFYPSSHGILIHPDGQFQCLLLSATSPYPGNSFGL